MTYRERREARAERLRTWAHKRNEKALASFNAAHAAVAGIPAGQPILVGHHSERHHRRDLERHDNAMRRGIESEQMAQSMTSRAAEIERQAEQAIYSDDADAIDRLRDKLADLEAQRERIKHINAAIRKGPGWEARITPALTEAESKELLTLARVCPWHEVDKKGFPPYHLQNLGGNITRTRKRIEELSGKPTRGLVIGSAAETAMARAGLQVEATMTTPSRPGKQPRAVWNVRGNLGEWRAVLLELGGTWYRGVFSFWEDPSAALETAVQAAEQESEAPPC